MPNLLAMALATASTIAVAVSMVFVKKATRKNLSKMLFDKMFIAGGMLFVAGIVLIILALKLEALSVVFPVGSLTYVWVMLLSAKFLEERINKWKIFALFFIVIGMLLTIF